MKRTPLNKKGKSEYSRAKQNLDEWFSRYIRLKEANNKGLVKCATCGAIKHYKEMDAGHFYNRNNLSVRWDERNVWPQCPKCNRFESGRAGEYADFMRGKFPPKELDTLAMKARTTTRWTTFDIKILAKEYREKVKKLKEKLDV